MQTFQIIVLSVATVVLILALTAIGLILGKRKTNLAYPPLYGTCPDYWTVASDGSSCIIPTAQSSLNVGSLYNPGTSVFNPTVQTTPGYSYDASNNQSLINFSNSGWQGMCSLQTWTVNNGVVWDGVTNYNLCTP